MWADIVQCDIRRWREDASTEIAAVLVIPIAAQAEWWTEHIAGEYGEPPCPTGTCLHYWQDGVGIEEMTFCVDDLEVGPLVAAGWLTRVPDDLYRLSWAPGTLLKGPALYGDPDRRRGGGA
jgi:hypothetical protein